MTDKASDLKSQIEGKDCPLSGRRLDELIIVCAQASAQLGQQKGELFNDLWTLVAWAEHNHPRHRGVGSK